MGLLDFFKRKKTPQLNNYISPFESDKVLQALQYLDPEDSQISRKALLKQGWLKYPYGRMREIDIDRIRRLSKSVWVQRCITTIQDEVCSAKWVVRAKDEKDKDSYEIQRLISLGIF